MQLFAKLGIHPEAHQESRSQDEQESDLVDAIEKEQTKHLFYEAEGARAQ